MSSAPLTIVEAQLHIMAVALVEIVRMSPALAFDQAALRAAEALKSAGIEVTW